MTTNGRNWFYFALSAGVIAVCSVALIWMFPGTRGILWLALYSIPAHMFISPFSHEAVLLYYAKFTAAHWCAIASLIGCLIAGLWDYWLFIPLIHHPRVRSKYARTGLYKKSVRLFRKWPFWALVIFGLTPIPFYPIKFLAIADHYPMRRYLLALIVGRTPRFYVLAFLGYVFKLPNWSLVVLALIILIVTIVKNRQGEKGNGDIERETDFADGVIEVCAAPSASEVHAKSTTSGRST
ncbi:MAG: VTT domain-containing protein [Candidatus Latescibacterota bacterium]|nr:MAG: VTT domain-containing protein [Candidatus Latescibacterota bacterium]